MLTLSPQRYWLAEPFDTKDLSTLFGDTYRVTAKAAKNMRLTYLDTFDWRLHAIGQTVCYEKRGGSKKLYLLGATDDLNDELAIDSSPMRASDLPDRPRWERAAKAVGNRALIQQLNLAGDKICLNIVDAEQRVVARGELERFGTGEAAVALRPRITLLPVSDYSSEFDRICQQIQSVAKVEEAPDALLDVGLALINRSPGDYSSKIRTGLKGEQSAESATKQILSELFETLERNIEGSRSDTDCEFLHDLRVACRRTRSALSQIPRVLPQKRVDEFKKRFSLLQQATGPTRDLDVFLEALPSYRKSLPEPMQADLHALEHHLTEKRARSQRALRRYLVGKSFTKLCADWRTFLEEGSTKKPAVDAQKPIKSVASGQIWKLYQQVLEEGRAISEQSPAESFHELRKSCKKLRYLIEFFHSLFSEEPIKVQVKALKNLLDCLGEFQDLAVQVEKLHQFSEEMRRVKSASTTTQFAMGALAADFYKRQQCARKDYQRLFEQFASPENQTAMHELLSAPSPSA